MVEVWLPYGKTEVVTRIPDEKFLGIVNAKENKVIPDPKKEIIRAIENPFGNKKLDDITKSGETVAIVVNDKTRATPNNLILLPLLEKLFMAGIRKENVTIIVGTGIHSSTKPNDVPLLIGQEISKKIKCVIHNCNAPDLVHIGDTQRGTKIFVNKTFVESDIRILTGDINIHYYAGYEGGRKSVLPGICGLKSIQNNHSFLLDPEARTGNLEGNPVHEDMMEAANLANVDFILNVVMNAKRQIVMAFAGDLNKAFIEGVKLVNELYMVPVKDAANIVIVSPGGYPEDANLYRAYKAINSALPITNKGGVIILLAECLEGHGNNVFHDWMMRFKTLKEIEKRITKQFVLGGHKAYYLTKSLEKVRIILVSTMPKYYSSVFKLKTAKTANIALKSAFKMVSKTAKVLAIPHGSTTFPIIRGD